MEQKRKFYALMTMLIILGIGLLFVLVLEKTSTRYIQRQKDEIRGYYTSLYFDSQVSGSGVVLENNEGWIDLTLMNYKDNHVTKRDITYTIPTIDTFYNQQGKPMEIVDGTQDLYVLDVWKKPQMVGIDTYKYDIQVLSSDATIDEDTDEYVFRYEKRDESSDEGIGKKHHITVQLKRKQDAPKMTNTEHVSIVIQLQKPYKEVYIIDLTISNQLIVFSKTTNQILGVDFNMVHIQTANIFSHLQEETTLNSVPRLNENNHPFSSKAFLVQLSWQGMLLDENSLTPLHNGAKRPIEQHTDQLYGLDITDSYVLHIQQSDSGGTLSLYVPQASDFNLRYLAVSDTYQLQATIYIYDETAKVYVLYDVHPWGGYEQGIERIYHETGNEERSHS
ncbi:MAG: hypothetical protein NC182_06210 [Prevotella sp.]|nr:hypothetical protein [Staphylococcus sp.]MCM1350778.1 hypothetical protein [Prevotella sp.]